MIAAVPALPARDAWRDARRVLAVRADSMGDVLMTTPALHALRTAAPGRQVTLLTSPGGAEAAALAPDVDDVIVHDAPWVKAAQAGASSRADRAMIRRLRAFGFDAAVIFTVYSQNPLAAALMCYLADVPLRLAHCRENPYQLLTHWVAEPEPERTIRHEVQRQLDLVESVGFGCADPRLRLDVPGAAAERVAARLAAGGLAPERPWLVVHAGASAPSRCYPLPGFASVIRSLVRTHARQVVLTGAAAEQSMVRRLQEQAGVPTLSLAGQLSLAETAALIARAPLLLSNNTGPVHVAAAVGTPVVDLYALTNPQHTPWRVPSRVLYEDVPCRLCYKSVCPEKHHGCLTGVPPERIVAAVLDLLDASLASTSPIRPARPTRPAVRAAEYPAAGSGA